MMIQTQAWSRLNQEPSAEPAGHSKKVCTGKAGVLVTQLISRHDPFFPPAGILSSVGAEWDDDCQAERGDQGEREREASLLNVAPIRVSKGVTRDALKSFLVPTNFEGCPYLSVPDLTGYWLESCPKFLLAGKLGKDVGKPGASNLDSEHHPGRLPDGVARDRADQHPVSRAGHAENVDCWINLGGLSYLLSMYSL